MEPGKQKQMKGAGAGFLAVGIPFFVLGVSGQAAFLGVGTAFLALGIVFLAVSRKDRAP